MQATSGPETVQMDWRNLSVDDLDITKKHQNEHIEETYKTGESPAAGLVHISEEENKVLRRKIHKRYASYFSPCTPGSA
jgi:hypothetical protein